MNAISMVRMLVSATILSAAVPGMAAGPEPYARDDAAYASEDFDAPAAVAIGGGDSDEWTPEVAQHDTTYPAGPVYQIRTDQIASVVPEQLGHDDAPYPAPDEATPRSGMADTRIAATTPSSSSNAD
jgi:hypothetical protein